MDKDKAVLEAIRLAVVLALGNEKEVVSVKATIETLSKMLPCQVGKEIRDAIDVGLESVTFIASRWLHKIEKGVYDYG